ncbi:MAG: aminotransferase class IV [Deltaproteobacteria bacterium]|nr:aminotransferase class IV [Deltaproteobacteria bacterium]
MKNGQVRHLVHHVQRLRRDALALGLAEPAVETIQRAFTELAHAEFGATEGIVRLAACELGGGGAVLIGTPRPVGKEPEAWTALTAPFQHPGPTSPVGLKLHPQGAFERARSLSIARGTDETILFDSAGRLVEGARSNLLVVGARGELRLPDRALGAVAGIALEVLSGQPIEAKPAEIGVREVAEARELIAVNAVRGAVPITLLDGRQIADGRPGPWSERLRALLG